MKQQLFLFLFLSLLLINEIQGRGSSSSRQRPSMSKRPSQASKGSSKPSSASSSHMSSSQASQGSSQGSQGSSQGSKAPSQASQASSQGSKGSSTPSKKKAIGFASALVIPDTVPVQAPVGQFEVPTTNAPGLPFPDLSFKNRLDSSIIPNMTAVVNGQIVGNIIKNVIMGTTHPKIWDATHCVQVPYFPRSKPQSDCETQSGYYMDISSGQCEPTDVTCSQLATLNFFANQSLCKEMCTGKNGKPLKVIPTNQNLDPRKTCIEPPIVKIGTSKKLEIVWTYDSSTMTCWKIKLPVDTVTSMNVYFDALAGAACQHMCHDVAPAGSGKGHSLLHSDEDNEDSSMAMMSGMVMSG